MKNWNTIIDTKTVTSLKRRAFLRSFTYFIRYFLDAAVMWLHPRLLWGYCWGSMQIRLFYSLQCGCYWPEAHPETLTNPGSADEWVKTELNETGSTSAPHKYMCGCECVCVVRCILYVCAQTHVCSDTSRALISTSLRVNRAFSKGASRTAGERNHTHSHKQSNQFVYQTQHLMVICECVYKMSK